MGGANNWRIGTNSSDWMRDIEKRLLHEERRPRGTSAATLLGPGFNKNAVLTYDWNGEPASSSGFWFSLPGETHAPNANENWIGQSIIAPDGSGIQIVYSVDNPSVAYYRTIEMVNGIQTFNPWTAFGTGGGGGGAPTGPAGGDLTGTYPNPEIAPGVIVDADVSATAAIQQSKIAGLEGDLDGKVDVAGDNMTGPLTVPTIGGSGGTDLNLSTHIAADGHTIWGVADPVNDDWVANKKYVDQQRLDVLEEGGTVQVDAVRMNFIGDAVTAEADGTGGVNVTISASGAGGGTAEPVGAIQLFSGTSVPAGWLLCDGHTFSSAQYPDLAAVLGDKYGTHSGTNYYKPNLQGRVPMGLDVDAPIDTDFTPLGKTGGYKDPTLVEHAHGMAHQHATANSVGGVNSTGDDTPDHAHAASTDSQGSHFHTVARGTAIGSSTGRAGAGNTVDAGAMNTSQDGAHGHNISVGGASTRHVHAIGASTASSTSLAGSAARLADGNLPPYIVLNFIIKALPGGGGGGGGSGAATFSAAVPALPAYTYTDVVHSLGTEDVGLWVRDATTKEGVDLDWKVVDPNTIALRSMTAVAADVLRVVVQA